MFVNKKTKGRTESVFNFHLWQCGKYKKPPQRQSTDWHKNKNKKMPTKQTNKQNKQEKKLPGKKKKKGTLQPQLTLSFVAQKPSSSMLLLSLDFNSQT